jgi:hypothetical protein
MRSRSIAVLLVVLGIVIGRLADVLPAIAQDGAPAPGPGTEDAPAQARETVPEGQPRYLAAMRTELEHMGIEGAACQATDAQRATCELTQRGSTSQRDFRLRIAYSDRTDTVYLYVERYLVAAQDGPRTDAVMRRLMELNWQMLLGKFEWDPTDGEVRLAMILNTDSNFDRRAFRSSVRGLTQLADRYWTELDRIQQTPAAD